MEYLISLPLRRWRENIETVSIKHYSNLSPVFVLGLVDIETRYLLICVVYFFR